MKLNKKHIIYIVLILFITLLIFNYYKDNVNCYSKRYILIEQYFDNTSSTHGGDCSNSCLFMKVLEVKSVIYYTDNYDEFQNEFKILFFGNEHKLRNDLDKEIFIKWCSTPYGERVRGIYN